MKLPNITGYYQAHSNNFTKGRGGRSIKYFTVHHSAGWEQTLRHLWANPSRQGSSTFYASGSVREQYVDTSDTPYTNGNFTSNQESLTCEVRGDWRNGYKDAATLNNLTEIMYQCLKIWPNLILTFHQDVTSTSTLCPADLKHKGYAAQCWANAKARIKKEQAPALPAKPKITYAAITPKRIKLNKDTHLWDFNFTDWSKVKSVQAFKKGELIDVVAIATNPVGAKYYMTAYSYNNGNIRATNGFNIKDGDDYVPPKPVEPPVVVPKWEPMTNPRKMRVETASRVFDLDAKKEVGDVIIVGTDVELVDKITTDQTYYRSRWAHDNNKNWGIPAKNVIELPDLPPQPVPEPDPEPPVDVDPTVPGAGDVVSKSVVVAFLQSIVKLITDFIDSLKK